MYIHEDLTESVIKWFYKVYNTLGYGFLEKVYHNALVHELQKQGFECKSQYAIRVVYDNLVVGEYFADILVNDVLILELKAAEVLCEEHEFQLINYLKATNLEIGLLLNFGKKPEVRRKIFTNDRKAKKSV
ncbi:MAG: GxxExxY protein [Bacteroidetes bacterium GWE2_42_24]|nr:MAG: GxxExxY protein [Bacteroidetes bacterium GWE2_42_24]OFY31184.1 MAG: GxxExxY protein [Bacteroidetes bacterium GWF2_43_11]HCT86506.1 GxxExxY protein [Candidatus Margulisiibacteriota bacterium]